MQRFFDFGLLGALLLMIVSLAVRAGAQWGEAAQHLAR